MNNNSLYCSKIDFVTVFFPLWVVHSQHTICTHFTQSSHIWMDEEKHYLFNAHASRFWFARGWVSVNECVFVRLSRSTLLALSSLITANQLHSCAHYFFRICIIIFFSTIKASRLLWVLWNKQHWEFSVKIGMFSKFCGRASYQQCYTSL